METQMHAAHRPALSRSIEDDLESYLDAIAGATMIFRSAVDAYLQNGADRACWQQAKLITEQLATLDDMQQKIETGVPARSALGELVADMVDPLTGVCRLLKDMKRQVTGFAIESGFSGPGRRVPAHLVAEVQELTDEVCATVDALVDSYRQRMPWSEQPSTGDQEQSVSWHEGRADRLSMQLLKTILADDAMNVEIKLPLAQFIEEIDRVADQAEGIDKELRFSRTRGQSPIGRKDTH